MTGLVPGRAPTAPHADRASHAALCSTAPNAPTTSPGGKGGPKGGTQGGRTEAGVARPREVGAFGCPVRILAHAAPFILRPSGKKSSPQHHFSGRCGGLVDWPTEQAGTYTDVGESERLSSQK